MWVAVGIVVAAGLTAGVSAATAPDPPTVQPPPPPANTVQYDSNGNVISSSIFNTDTNTLEIRTGAATNTGPLTGPPVKPYPVGDPGPAPDIDAFYDPTNGGAFDSERYQLATQMWNTQKENYQKYQSQMDTYNTQAAAWEKQQAAEAAAAAERAIEKARQDQYWKDYEQSKIDAAAQKVQAEADRKLVLDKIAQQEQQAAAQQAAANSTWATTKQTAAQAAATRAQERAGLAAYRDSLLGYLNQTPAERQAQYDEYGTTYSNMAHAEVDPQFEKFARTQDEQMNATGMFGSRAYVDTKNELTKDKLKSDAYIANNAIMAKEQLSTNDKALWNSQLNALNEAIKSGDATQAQIDDWIRNGELADQATRANIASNLIALSSNTSLNSSNLINQINAGQRDNSNLISSQMAQIKAGNLDAINMQNQTAGTYAGIQNQALNTAANISGNAYAAGINSNAAANNAAMAKWQAKQAQSASYTNAASNMAGGLLYLHGNKSGGTVKNYNPNTIYAGTSPGPWANW